MRIDNYYFICISCSPSPEPGHQTEVSACPVLSLSLYLFHSLPSSVSRTSLSLTHSLLLVILAPVRIYNNHVFIVYCVFFFFFFFPAYSLPSISSFFVFICISMHTLHLPIFILSMNFDLVFAG